MNVDLNRLEPQVKECLAEAMHVVRSTAGNECAERITNENLLPAFVDYNQAAFMHGYFRACAHLMPDYRTLFYTAATIMIHFKYYHYNEGDNNND